MTEFNFDEFMTKAALNERREQLSHKLMCKESISKNHSDQDANGKCNWCGIKIAARSMRPPPPIGYVSNLDEAYDYFYNPDDQQN